MPGIVIIGAGFGGIERVDWDDGARRWNVETVENGEMGGYRPRAVITAGGALHLPSDPDIPGAARSGGTSFHSARWDHSCDLAGRRVAVIGTGASAIQFVPAVAEQASHLTVFQRTPPWIHPRPDVEIPPRMRAAFRKAPITARALRDTIYLAMEVRALGFAINQKLMAPLQFLAVRHLESQVADPGLRARLTADYTIGCIESQIQHVLSCLRLLATSRADTIEVSEPAQRRYNDELQRRLRRAVWSEGGCRSWYLSPDGVNRTLWPGFTFEYWARTRRARRADYAVTAR